MRNNKGQFEQGNKGKPKGAVNRTTKEVKELLTNFLYDKVEDLYNIYDSLDDKDKANLFIHVSKLVLPKPDYNSDLNIKDVRFDFDNQPTWQIVDGSKKDPYTFEISNKETETELKKLFKEEQ
jgi:hypothetical protein